MSGFMTAYAITALGIFMAHKGFVGRPFLLFAGTLISFVGLLLIVAIIFKMLGLTP